MRSLNHSMRIVPLIAVLVATVACTASPANSPSSKPGEPSARPSASPSQVPIALASGSPMPTVAPSPTPVASPTLAPSGSPTPAPAKWSKPKAVGSSGQCYGLAAVIDTGGGNHLAVACDARIWYSAQNGADWDTHDFAPPDKRQERDPQLAVQGDLLYLAYTRVAVADGGCGDDGLRDVGVYVRTRSLPDGRWSDPTRIGEVADRLQSFRVGGGTIHATVENADDGRVYYETVRGATYRRYEIPNATGDVALRIGDDGNARIAYEADAAIRYGAFTGSGFSTKEIAGSKRGYGPVLVLGAGDRPYLLWRRGYHSGGCTEPEPKPEDGTHFSTIVGDTWESHQLTTREGVASLTLDTDTGRVHALAQGRNGLVYMTKSGGGSWSKRVFKDLYPGDAVVRLDPETGALVVAYTRYQDEGSRVYVMTYR